MDCHVDVKISSVDEDEINLLNTVMSTIPGIPLERYISRDRWHKEYVVSIEQATLKELKKVLHVVMPVVKSERIEIET